MIPRGKIDIGFSDIAAGMLYCLYWHTNSPKKARFTDTGNTFFCLSVRTGFDLVLKALKFPSASEILVTDVNIPDMFSIITGHGLKPIPVSVNKHTLGISAAQVEAAITPASKAILVTHLFGALMEMDDIITIAQKHNLIIIEDCAQAYIGASYMGNTATHITLFSFGFIKTNTAVNGAMLRINNAPLFTKVIAQNELYVQKTNSSYFNKLLKALMALLLTQKLCYTLFYYATKFLKKDFDTILSSLTKGYPGNDIFSQIRFRPSTANIKLMEHRLNNFKQRHMHLRTKLAQHILQGIPEAYKTGVQNARHSHWVIPVEHPQPQELIAHLRKHGFDATQKASSLIKLANPGHTPMPYELIPANLVYLPNYPGMSYKDRIRLATLVANFQHQEVVLA